MPYPEAGSASQLREKHLLDDSVLEEQQQQVILGTLHPSTESPASRHKHSEGVDGEEGEKLLTRHA